MDTKVFWPTAARTGTEVGTYYLHKIAVLQRKDKETSDEFGETLWNAGQSTNNFQDRKATWSEMETEEGAAAVWFPMLDVPNNGWKEQMFC